MAVVYEKTKGLTDVELHYCPGCNHGIIQKLVAEVLEELFRRGGVTEPDADTLADWRMIGDRIYDVEGAAAFGMKSVGVTWGFRSREELSAYGPWLLAETPDDIASAVSGQTP